MSRTIWKRFGLLLLAGTLLCTPVSVYAEDNTADTKTTTEAGSAESTSVTKKASTPVRTVEQDPKTKTWYCMLNGKRDKKFTGLAKRPDTKKWYFFRKGKLNLTFTGIDKDLNTGIWCRMNEGRLDTSFTGLARRPDNRRWYFFRKGKLDLTYTGVAKNLENNKWYRVEKGRINKKYTGVAERPETGRMYYFKNGILEREYTGIAKSKETKKWYRIENGKVNTKYDGIALRPETRKMYYFEKGILQKGYSGLAKDPSTEAQYLVAEGKVNKNFTGAYKNAKNNKIYYITKGKWDNAFCGFIDESDGKHYYYNHGIQKLSIKYKNGKTYFYKVGSKTPVKSQRQLLLLIMRSWIGLNMADGSHHSIIDTYNSIYPLPINYKVTYYDDWCDTCVSAAGIATGLSGYFGRECGVQRHINVFKSLGIWQEDGRVTPKAGDLIVFTWGYSSQPNDGFANHIAVVEKVKNGKITILEGNNKEGAVGRRVFNVGHPEIRGYAIPRFTS